MDKFPVANVAALSALLNRLEASIPLSERLAAGVSAAPVRWHIHHTLLVLNQVVHALRHSDPDTYRWKFSGPKTVVYALGRIPRGRVKAPKSVRPETQAEQRAIGEELVLAFRNIEAIAGAHPNAYFRHPFFGNLNKKATIKFLQIHTRHHLQIIDEIIKNSTP